MRNPIYIFWIIATTMALGQMMADIYLPSLLPIASSLNTSISNAQFSLSIYMLGFSVSQFIYGPISDGIGRLKPLCIGLGFCFVGSILCWTAQDIYLLWAGRLAQGIGAGTLTLLSAMMRDLFEGERLAKYGSYSALVMSVVLSFAPLLGGYFQEYLGWRSTFVFLTIFSGLILFIFIFFVPETNRFKNTENLQLKLIGQNSKHVLTSPIFIGYATCSMLTYGAILSWLTSGPVILEKVVGISPVQFGWVYAATGAAFALGAFTNGKLVEKMGINRMLQFGLVSMLFAGLLMLTFSLLDIINVAVIAGPAMLLLFASSLIFPNTSAGLFQPFPHIAGIVSSLFYGSRMLGGALFSAIIALLPNTSQMPMSIAFIVSGLVSWVVFYIMIYHTKQDT